MDFITKTFAEKAPSAYRRHLERPINRYTGCADGRLKEKIKAASNFSGLHKYMTLF
jgi:hypothetical protein